MHEHPRELRPTKTLEYHCRKSPAQKKKIEKNKSSSQRKEADGKGIETWNVCMYVCIYVSMYACIKDELGLVRILYVRIHTYYIHIHTYYIHTYVCMSVCLYVCMYGESMERS